MKDCAFNPFLPLDVYIPDGEPHVLTAGCIFSAATTGRAEAPSASLTMSFFRRLSMT